MNPTVEGTAPKPSITKRFFTRAGSALGVQVANVETNPQAAAQVPPVIENAFKNAPAGSLDPTVPAHTEPMLPTIPTPDIPAPVANIVPVEPLAEDVPSEEVVPSPVMPVSEPTVPVSAPEPTAQVSMDAPVNMPVQPLESQVIPKPEEQESEEKKEDLVATELISQNPEHFIKDKVLDIAAVAAAKNLVNQLHEAGVVNPEAVSKILQPILSKAA